MAEALSSSPSVQQVEQTEPAERPPEYYKMLEALKTVSDDAKPLEALDTLYRRMEHCQLPMPARQFLLKEKALSIDKVCSESQKLIRAAKAGTNQEFSVLSIEDFIEDCRKAIESEYDYPPESFQIPAGSSSQTREEPSACSTGCLPYVQQQQSLNDAGYFSFGGPVKPQQQPYQQPQQQPHQQPYQQPQQQPYQQNQYQPQAPPLPTTGRSRQVRSLEPEPTPTRQAGRDSKTTPKSSRKKASVMDLLLFPEKAKKSGSSSCKHQKN